MNDMIAFLERAIERDGTQREHAMVEQIIRDYRTSDGAILRQLRDGAMPDRAEPGWASIYGGRDAFASVIATMANAFGWPRA